ncbi:MAG: hypothetical protein RL701_5837 [Pseudomonadota bacterium]
MKLPTCTACATAVLLVGTAACAGARLSSDTANDVRHSAVTVGFYNIDRQIEYEEEVFNGAYIAARRKVSRFGDLWDVDNDLGAIFAEALRRLGLQTRGPEQHGAGARNAAYRHLCTEQWIPNEGWRALALPESHRAVLRAQGSRYLILWCSTWFGTKVSPPQRVATIFLPGSVFIYDVTSGVPIFTENVNLNIHADFEHSIREIERDGLSPLRRATAYSLISETFGKLSQALQVPPEQRMTMNR